LKDAGTDGKVILKNILKEQGGRVWSQYIWLRTGASGVAVGTH
jgi:hypothetical protein